MSGMANIREIHDFKGDDVVLLWLTRSELPVLRQAVGALRANDDIAVTLGECRLLLNKHPSTGANLARTETEICLTETDVEQLEGLVDGLVRATGPGHQFLDIAWPVPTLMISVDEYPTDFA
jgi:hypothetical protein